MPSPRLVTALAAAAACAAPAAAAGQPALTTAALRSSAVARPAASAASAAPHDSTARPGAPAATAPATAPAPARAPRWPGVAFKGEVRSRSEVERAGGGASPADATTFLRTRLGARAPLGAHAQLVFGVQADGVLDDEAAPGTTGELDVYEGYLEVGAAVRGARVAARAGRQELAVSNERLVGRRNWANTRHSFDGVRLVAGPAGDAGAAPAWSATAFVVTPAVHARTPGAASAFARTIAGVDAVRPVAGATAELTVLHDRGARARGREVAGRTTVAGRLRAPRLFGVVAADLEADVQAGSQRLPATAAAPAGPHEAIRAWMLGARVGAPARAGRRLTGAVGLDLLSGDAPSSPARHGAFDTLYGSNHSFYGFADMAGGNPASTLKGRGLADALATASLAATRRATVRADLHRMAPVRGGGTLGWELDVITPVRVGPKTVVELGFTGFRAGAAGEALGLGRAGATRGWGYLQFTAAL